jgi:hypothetical protein
MYWHSRSYYEDSLAYLLLQALNRSNMILEQTKLIIFFGTPHRGSSSAYWARFASNLRKLALQDSNKKILGTLEVNGEVLDNIQEKFKTIAFEGKMKFHSFQEAQGITGVKGLSGKVCLLLSYKSLAQTSRDVADNCR